MASDDDAVKALGEALIRVWNIPHAKVRAKALMDAMLWIAKRLGVKVEWE